MKTLPDIYYSSSYGRLYEEVERAECVKFEYSDVNGSVLNMFMKRPIPWLIDGVQYYDIVTPYGYGGPVVMHAENREALLQNYWTAWNTYCMENRIVCEFVRFHPLIANHLDFMQRYDAKKNRNTLAIELTEDFFMTQFSAKCRNAIRKAEKMGVVCEVDTDCETIENFRTLYYKTMTKDHADEYYFFSMEYFNRMKEDLGGQILLINALLDGRIIASSLFMLSDSFMHYHLSATDPEFYTFSANNLILKAAAELGNRTGRQWLHLGGGLSSSESDSLFKFKRSFAREERNLKEFWLGKAVYMQDIYNRLVDLRRAEGQFDEGTGFFPAYRAKK